MSTKTETATCRQFTRKDDEVTVTTTVTETVTKDGEKPRKTVNTTEKVYSYSGKDGFEKLPDDLRKALDEKSAVDPKKINKKAAESDFDEKSLKLINKYRKKHGVPELKQSDDLVKYAKKRVEEMAKKDGFGGNVDLEIGESVYCISSNDPEFKVDADETVDYFYSQGKDYDYSTEPETLKKGHFSQMVWKSSKHFGAAAAKSDTNKVFTIFVYQPRGNTEGEFVKNVIAPNKDQLQTRAKPPARKVSRSDSSGSDSDDDLDKFNLEGVEAHNKYRKLHGVPPVKYNKEIAKHAQEWAEHLAKNKLFKHRDINKKHGENLYCSMGEKATASKACESWYDEIKDYNFNAGVFASNTGHFTQVVWKESTEIGMGRAKGANNTWIVVANYNPPGNYMGRFQANVSKPISK